MSINKVTIILLLVEGLVTLFILNGCSTNIDKTERLLEKKNNHSAANKGQELIEKLNKKEGVIIPPNALSPNGKRIIGMSIGEPIPEASSRPMMWIMDAETGEYIPIVESQMIETAGTNISGISWSRNSKNVAITMYTGHGWLGRLILLSVSDKIAKEKVNLTIIEYSENKNLITSLIYHSYSPSFSPDEKKVLFSAIIEEKEEHFGQSKWIEAICIINTDGSGFTQLTEPDIKAWLPVWSHGGRKIIYVVPTSEDISKILDPEWLRKSGKGQIWIMNCDGSSKKFLAEGSDPSLYVEGN